MQIIKLENERIVQQANYIKEEIKKGKIIVSPTDTVYGLICDGLNDKSKEEIYFLKRRTKEKPLIGFISDIEKAKKFAEISPSFVSFINSKWPGATTFILKAKINIPYLVSPLDDIGLRVPGFPFLLEILKDIEILASTSANISFEKSPSIIDEIPKDIKEKVDIVIDGGKLRGKESTIWNISGNNPKLVRGKILFVCEGNLCRSPIAEYILKEFLKGKDIKIEVNSAGVGFSSFPSSNYKNTTVVMKEIGIKMDGFYPKHIDFEMVNDADLIFVMEEKHAKRITLYHPEIEEKIIVLNVKDPIGKDITFFRKIRDEIKEKIEKLVLGRIYF